MSHRCCVGATTYTTQFSHLIVCRPSSSLFCRLRGLVNWSIGDRQKTRPGSHFKRLLRVDRHLYIGWTVSRTYSTGLTCELFSQAVPLIQLEHRFRMDFSRVDQMYRLESRQVGKPQLTRGNELVCAHVYSGAVRPNKLVSSDVNLIREPFSSCLSGLENHPFQWIYRSGVIWLSQEMGAAKDKENFGRPKRVSDNAASLRVLGSVQIYLWQIGVLYLVMKFVQALCSYWSIYAKQISHYTNFHVISGFFMIIPICHS